MRRKNGLTTVFAIVAALLFLMLFALLIALATGWAV